MQKLSGPQVKRITDYIVVLVVVAIVIFSRWDAITLDYQLNPDESSFAAQGMRVLNGAIVPWKDNEAGSSSAATPALAALVFAIGLPQDYLTLHLLAALLVCLELGLLYWIARILLPLPVAVAILVLLSLVVAMAQTQDFTHYAGELLPNLFLTVGVLCLILAGRRPDASMKWSLVGAAWIGVTPFMKLQFAPVALGLMLFAACEQLFFTRVRFARRCGRVFLLATASAAPGAALLIWVSLCGGWPEFVNSYILTNLAWSPGPKLGGGFASAISVTFFETFSVIFTTALSLLAFSSFGLYRKQPRLTWVGLRDWVLSAVFVASAVFCVVRPSLRYGHHQWLLVPAFGLFAFLAAGLFIDSLSPFRRSVRVSLCCSVLILPFITSDRSIWDLDQDPLAEFRFLAENPVRSSYSMVSRRVRLVAPDAKSLFVWGWSDALYLHTHLRPVSKFTCTVFLIEDFPGRQMMRNALLEEFKKDPPDVVIDAVAPGLLVYQSWTIENRISMFPELAKIIQSDYNLVYEQPVSSRKYPARIYVRKTLHHSGQGTSAHPQNGA